MKNKLSEFKVGLFAITGLALFASSLVLLGGGKRWFSRQNLYFAHFESVDGLIPGAKVVLSGIQIGTVDDISIDSRTRDVAVKLVVDRKFHEWIREGTEAEMATMGVLGDKFIRLTQGNPDSSEIADYSSIPVRSTKDFGQVLNKGDQLLVTLNSIAGSMDRLLKGFEKGNRAEQIAEGLATTSKNLAQATSKLATEMDQLQLKESIKNLNSILEKINNGRGSLGALINDPALYDDAKALVGGTNRNRIVRNLVRQTIQNAEAGNKK